MHKHLAQFLESKRPPLFAGLDESGLQTLLAHAVIQDGSPHHLLVQQGDIPAGLYLVIDGTMRTLRSNENGEEVTIRLLESGDTCLEDVLFMGGPSSISVQTLTAARVLLIPARVIRQQVLDDRRFAMNIIGITTRHYKNAIHQIDAMNIKSPLQRVGYYFLEKHLESGHNNLEFTLPFRKQTIANYLGMTPETFSRALKQMRDMGISIDDDVIRMKDAYSLCHFCDSDSATICTREGKENCPHCVMHKT